jgi:catechol 2,3-dioxygenase-like lactoylglutathione lyase family enzyme
VTVTAAAPTLSFVLVVVDDLDASRRYLQEQLGLTYVPEQSGEGFHQFVSGPGGIDFGLISAREWGKPAGTAQLYFYTDDIERLRATLLERGVAAGPIQQPPFGTIFDVPSPNGEPPITMMQPPA